MQYTDTDTDYATLERNAYQRGDMALATACAAAMDAESAADEAGRLRDVVEGIRERITEANWRTGKKAELRKLIEAVINELAEG